MIDMKAHIGLTANKYSKQNYKYLRRPGKHSSHWLSQVWEKTLINVLNFISSVTEISFPGFLVIEIIHCHSDCLQPSCIPNVLTNARETGVFLFHCFCIKNVAGLPFTLFCPSWLAEPVRRANKQNIGVSKKISYLIKVINTGQRYRTLTIYLYLGL